MKNSGICLLAFLAVASTALAAQSSYDLKSPDTRIEIRVRTSGQLRYDVLLRGNALLENSMLSLDVEHKKLGLQPKVNSAKQRSNDQVVEPVVRQKFAKIRDRYNELRLTMDGGYSIVFRAYNEGVAYRFETTLPDKRPISISPPISSFTIPRKTRSTRTMSASICRSTSVRLRLCSSQPCPPWWTGGVAPSWRLPNRT